jgi:hypothetical protein
VLDMPTVDGEIEVTDSGVTETGVVTVRQF